MRLNSGIALALAMAATALISGCTQPRVARAPVPPPPPPASATRNQRPQTGRQSAAGTTAAPVQKRRKMRRVAAEKTAAETNAAGKAPTTPAATPAAPTTPATTLPTTPAAPPAAPTSSSDQEISTGTEVEMRHDLQTTSQLVDSALSRVNSLRKPLSAEEQQQVAQIRNYVKQSRAAAANGDTERARNLALKGHLLADELSRRH